MREIDKQNNYALEYNQELINSPGCIQPHGFLLVLNEKNYQIIHVSENTEDFLGIKPSSLIGMNLKKLFSPYQVNKIRQELSNNDKYNINLKIKLSSQTFQVLVHKNRENIIIELEKFIENKNNNINKNNLFETIRKSIYNLKQANNFAELCQEIAIYVKNITQFDRVMIYEFKEDNSGVVIGEAKENHLESYLNLHYPEFDIPERARKFYYENWLRIIPNVNYKPISLTPKPDFLDLTHSALRSVSPCHLTYLKNMGVTASMSISLIDENRLWGLIACHHYSPKYIDYQTKKTCEILGQFMSLQTKILQEKEFQKYEQKIEKISLNIRQKLTEKPTFINEIIKNNEFNLLNLVNAEGMALIIGKQVSLKGKTPLKPEIKEIINHLLKPEKKEIFVTDCLAKNYPEAEKLKDIASGILAVSIFLNSTSYHIIWFRPEQIQTIHWAGNPDPVFVNINNLKKLSPRYSFELWKETVKNKSLPWQKVEIEAAQELRNIILLAGLEFSHFSQEILEETAKKAEAANLAKSQFLAKMSHELRTPLNAILGFSQIMSRDHSLSDEQQDFLGIINHSGEYLLSLINDVLAMSKIEAGQLNLNHHPFDFLNLITSIRDMFLIKATEKGLYLSLEKDENLPQYLMGDEAKIRQIIVNLIANAIKFTDFGQVILRVHKIQQNDNNITLKIEVQDTGKGINQEEINFIFEPFKQAENNQISEQGTGLGLAICRQFINLMNGKITVKSTLNQGSIFTCILPLKIAPQTSFSPQNNPAPIIGLAPDQPSFRILIVEDRHENQKLMIHLLKTIGFQVNYANNGLEAITLWQKWKPDLIFMDMRMPQLNGYQATARIREQEIKLRRHRKIPIIALTATAFDEEKEPILAVGCNDVIYKPFKEEVLFEIIKKYLGVKYIYENKIENSHQNPEQNPLNWQNKINFMPFEWVEKLKKAALSARENNILKLIKEIPQEHFSLAQELTKMLNNLAFNDIVNLTENHNHD